MIKKINIIGAGLYGCLTAWKIKEKFPNFDVNLIDSSDHIISSLDPIKIGNKLYNNGFHGIELPRSKNLYDFLTSRLNIKLIKKNNNKKLFIDGILIDYISKSSSYPKKIRNYYNKIPTEPMEKYDEALSYVSDDFKKFLKKISTRYSNRFSDVQHLLIPWFFPSEFDILSTDEGAKFRTNVRSGKIKSYYSWTESMLLSDIQKPFYSSLKSLGVNIYLNSKVDFENSGITISNQSIEENRKIKIKPNEIVFNCLSPIGILKNLSSEAFNNIIKHSKVLLNSIVKVKSYSNTKSSLENFTEILCADQNFFELSRISKPFFNIKKNDEDYFQMEIFVNKNWNKKYISEKINNFYSVYFKKYNYKLIEIIDIKETRKVFFPSEKSLNLASDYVKNWSNKFPNYKILHTFGPINMAKTWTYSEENIDFIKKIVKEEL